MLRHWQPLDLRGIAKLATGATLGITGIVEGVHQSVLGSMGLPGGKEPGRARGFTGLVYKSVRGVTHLVGQGLDQGLGMLESLLPLETGQAETRERAALLAAINGVMGDRLAASGSTFATVMTMYSAQHKVLLQVPVGRQAQSAAAGQAPADPAVSGKILLLIHGLCMNDLQWQSGPPGSEHDHGAILAEQLGYTPVYLRYNSGLHVSQNGQPLAAMLQRLLDSWPVAVSELTVVVHSMGGLLIRSACYTAQQQGLNWPQQLKNIVFLGTPHHGAPLERAGNWVDLVLASTPYSKPFAKIGHLRSSGITDLRYGFVLEQDWTGRDRFQRVPDQRQNLPLPSGVKCYTLAAALAGESGVLAERLLGDGLVPLHSALGRHDDPARNLQFDGQAILYHLNHMAILSSPQVTQQLLAWLTPH